MISTENIKKEILAKFEAGYNRIAEDVKGATASLKELMNQALKELEQRMAEFEEIKGFDLTKWDGFKKATSNPRQFGYGYGDVSLVINGVRIFAEDPRITLNQGESIDLVVIWRVKKET